MNITHSPDGGKQEVAHIPDTGTIPLNASDEDWTCSDPLPPKGDGISLTPVIHAPLIADEDGGEVGMGDPQNGPASSPESQEGDTEGEQEICQGPNHLPLDHPAVQASLAEKEASADAMVETHLNSFAAGWPRVLLDNRIDQFLGVLVEIGREQGVSKTKTDQYLSWLIDRLKVLDYHVHGKVWYHKRFKEIAKLKAGEQLTKKKDKAAQAEAEGKMPRRFEIRTKKEPIYVPPQEADTPFPPDPVEAQSETPAFYDHSNMVFLSNFVVVIDEDIVVRDEFETRRYFRGRVKVFDQELPLTIAAEDFEDNRKLLAAIRTSAGCLAVVRCNPAELRRAILEVSYQQYSVRRRTVTNDFGWDAEGTRYAVPSGRITASGFELASPGMERRVELSEEAAGIARYLDLTPLDPELLMTIKQHVVQDLLHVNHRQATYSLMGTVSAAVLYRFAPEELGRYVLWLMGLTGSGKSFAARLIQNFFGNFATLRGNFATWGSTPNFLQMQGYYFRDAVYLVDDFKPMALRQGQLQQIIWLLQTFADNTARGRLNADSSAKTLRPIRGILVATGEDVPEHSASTTARSIIIDVPNNGKDVARGILCMDRCRHYSGVTADFIRWLLANGRTNGFAARVRFRQQYYRQAILGRQNADRIAGNFGLLAAAFEEFAAYLADVWPEQQAETLRFVEEDLVAIRNTMVAGAREQQESEIFLAVVGDLLAQHEVGLFFPAGNVMYQGKPHIGRRLNGDLIQINTNLALKEVNQFLRNQGRSPLQVSNNTLLRQLQQDGHLVGPEGQPLSTGSNPTQQAHLGNQVLRCFTVRRQSLPGAGN